MRGVLVATGVECVVGPSLPELEPGRGAEHVLDVRANAFQEPLVGVARSDPPQGDLAHVAAARAAPSSASGRRIVIVVPCPTWLSTCIDPPCFSTMP